MVEKCWGGSGYSAETPGRLGFKGLRELADTTNFPPVNETQEIPRATTNYYKYCLWN